MFPITFYNCKNNVGVLVKRGNIGNVKNESLWGRESNVYYKKYSDRKS